ncbi:MAG: helix-turn-helix domain-containing protein, partial [Bacteroidales bacterium]|nr:helix-turn-helix domain-containing protein [Bacteroidales bacterium]
MKYLSVKDFASKYGVSERTIRNYCVSGKIEGAFLTGKTWNIPEDANLPQKGKHSVKETPLVHALRFEKENKIKGGIYHKTQIELTYNSNHIEGSRLSQEQTRYIFETNTIGITEDVVSVDDIIETVNHFKCIDYIINCV